MTDLTRSMRPVSPLANEVSELLRRYDRLSARESERLLEAFKALTILDLALMTSDEALRAALDAFREDHKRALRPPLLHYVWFLALPALLLVAAIWASG
jgi:hypothetical protein